MDAPARPQLPHGHYVDLPGRGRVFYREVAGPPGAPVLMLLHGWTITADLNWHMLYEPLGRRFRVIALDHRGHGRGIRAHERFTLEDCADDAAALLRHLDVERAIPVGYSMGGIVAQLLWKRHRNLVQGLVLCATAGRFTENWRDKTMFGVLGGLSYAARQAPEQWRRRVGMHLATRRSDLEPWVVEELESHDWARVGEAGLAIGAHDSTKWMRSIDVPTAVIATLHDEVVQPMRQLRMARQVPGADLHLIEGTHAVCSEDPDRFGGVLVTAIRQVARRAVPNDVFRTETSGRRRNGGVAVKPAGRRWSDHPGAPPRLHIDGAVDPTMLDPDVVDHPDTEVVVGASATGNVTTLFDPTPTSTVDEHLHDEHPSFTVWRSQTPRAGAGT